MRSIIVSYSLKIVFCVIILFLTQSLLVVYFNKNPSQYENSSGNGQNTMLDFTKDFSAKNQRESIFFLKTHKCGSSTIQNILLRFGFEYNLIFALPEKGNYFGHPRPFDYKMIPNHLRSFDNKYNIFTHHARYIPNIFKQIMKRNAVFVTILRDPASLFESMYTFYHLDRRFNQVTFKMFLEEPKKYEATFLKTRSGYKYGRNQMCFDLGLDEKLFFNERAIQDFISVIENDFDLVLISEYMEISLILLADLMNWSLDQVVFLPTNVRQSELKEPLNKTQKEVLRSINKADSILYEYFLNKFKEKVKKYGVDRMKTQLEELIDRNNAFYFQCVDKENTKGYAKTLSYTLRPTADLKCSLASSQELPLTEMLRKYQTRKLKKIKDLHQIVNERTLK